MSTVGCVCWGGVGQARPLLTQPTTFPAAHHPPFFLGVNVEQERETAQVLTAFARLPLANVAAALEQEEAHNQRSPDGVDEAGVREIENEVRGLLGEPAGGV